MRVPSPKPARPTRHSWAAAGMALAVTAAMLTPMPAAAAAAVTAFGSSFETDDAAPVLTGTGEAVNVTGSQFGPGSVLGDVTAVTASAENTPNEAAAFVADGNAGSKWLAFTNAAWVQYELDEAQPMVRYTLTSGNDAPERDPRDFRVQASNNGTDWVTVDERTGEQFSARGETRTFELATPSEPHLFYRLDVLATRTPSANIVQLADWEPIAVDGATPEPADLLLQIGNGPTSSDTAKTGVGFTGTKALQYVGRHLAAGPASSTSVLYDDAGIAVQDDSELSYLVFPVLDGEQTYAATFVAVDLLFDDGTTLSTSGAVDSYGFGAQARQQGQSNVLWPNQWNKVTVDLGQFAGRTVQQILFRYDHPGADVKNIEVPTGSTAFSGWLDDVSIDAAEERDTSDGLVSYVDTRRGTNSTGGFSRGNNLPATAWPNGFNFITPMTNADNVGTIYQYQRANNAQNLPALNGIGLSHQPSIWMGDRNQIAVMPAANADPTSSLNDRKLTFRHENETARPDIYGVEFDNGIHTEVTATDHGAIYRFEFAGDASSVLIDQLVDSSKLTISGDTVSGWVDGGSGWPGRTRMYVYGTFDRQPTNAGATTRGDRNGTARFAAFDTTDDRSVELRLSSSFISQDQAKANHGFELADVSFDAAHAAVRDAWNERLSVVHDVEGATDTQLVTLYSSLYRLNLYPNSQFENTGTEADPVYKYASPVSATTGAATDTQTNAKIVDGKIYVNNGFWDTYRTAWPLYSLLYPDVTEELVDGFVQQYRDGGWVARWSSPGYADLMTGTSSDVAFAEAYLAGSLSTETALEAYDAAVKNATVLPASNAVGRKGLGQSIFLGYTEATTHESASWGLEGYINDFGIAQMAKALAEDPKTPADRVAQLEEEATYFEARAAHYVEMYNPEAGTFTSRNADGSWTAGAEFDRKAWGGAFTEASAWTFAFHAPHDVDGLAALYGGRQGLIDEMREFLTVREKADYSGIHEAREARDVRLGMLGMSNQIAHHIPYVLAEAGDPAGAQALIRDIQDRLFVGSDIGQGYPGDEDNGEFSAWYLFSALGFYPLEVGSGNYTIGTPLFDSATLSIGDKELVINAPGAAEGNDYVAGVSINGEAITETTFNGDLIREGGQVDFTMSATPTSWGAKDLGEKLEAPASLVDATKPGRGSLTATDGTPVGSLVDDNMNSKVAFPGNKAELVWTSQSGPVSIGQYTLTSAAKADAPTSWTLEGSVDGSTWTEIDSRDGESFLWDTQTRPFTAKNGDGFTSVRLTLTGESAALGLSEIELFASSAAAEGLSISAASPQRVAVDTEFAGQLATIVGTETDAAGYDVTVDYGDGSEVTEGTLVRDDLGGWKVSAPHTFTAPGTYSALVTVRDSSGAVAQTTATVAVYRDETFVGALNNVCIGDLGVTAANCDSQGHGYYRDKLAADGFVQGETLTIPGTELTYDLPAVEPGAPDNITGEGQSVKLSLGTDATQISFVGTATESNRDSEAVLHFTDGSEQPVTISLGDWVGASGNPYKGNTVLTVSEGRLSGTGAEGGGPKNTAIYATAPITLDVDEAGAPKVVESLTMPKEPGDLGDGRVHLFAIASDGDRAASAPLAVEPGTVSEQIAGEAFEATLATVAGGMGETTANVNWGDGSPVSAVDITDGVVASGHTYATAGTYTVTVTADDGVQSADAQLEIVVVEPEPEFDPQIVVPAEARPGDTVTVTGTGFAPGEKILIRIDDEKPTKAKAEEDGTFSAKLRVPKDAVDGDHPVVAVGEISKIEARASLRVAAEAPAPQETSVKLKAGSKKPVAGESVALTASVKPKDADGTVQFLEGDTVVGSATVTAGTATADVVIATSGKHTYVARFVPSDEKSYAGSESSPLTLDVRSAPVLDAELEITQKKVVQGGSVEIAGRGFAAGETVAFTLHSDPIRLGEVTADGTGAFRVDLAVPASAPAGAHTLVAEGAESGLSAEVALQVTAAASASGGGLAGTGGAIPYALLGLILVLVTVGGVLVLRRRRQAD
ncbi:MULTISPECIES: GH92 family glycosyl hydrolase [unclassified Microbacterium]|uniref:GH92 family glycosyl hydrolase n=1 Tax=unclassified Microbacterium TaxID=2609290 RepID=UPI000EAA3D85|nr:MULTISPECIES: GH92 family glycosyl hydrolase [unclassified Microbacterium]MBT2484078.1 GH92 family glycosyl hydrolase [Microbacterium sp. ISL-108]RKN67029.1 ATP-binding protein [Microbacterium sp. CGR2]